MLEKDFEIFDVLEAPSGNLFIKVSDEYSLAIGSRYSPKPNIEWGELTRSQYVKRSEITPMIKVGRLVFD